MRSTAPEQALGIGDLRRVFALLDEVAAAGGVQALREQVMESLGRHFGYRNATFFVGPTLRRMFADQQPVVNGVAARMAPAYVESYRQHDPFALVAAAADRNRPHGPLWLGGLAAMLRRPQQQRYLETFLLRHGIQDKLVLPLPAGPQLVGGIGILSEHAFAPRDRAVAGLLTRHLRPLLALQADIEIACPQPDSLPPRQAAVADLVARGLTNQEVAQELHITVDTVKKHLTAALKATGCTSRTQLALHRHSRSPAAGRGQ
jgi:DNA-binding CsgD family transcriptional regulator